MKMRDKGSIHIFAWPFRFDVTPKEHLGTRWKVKDMTTLEHYMLQQYLSGGAREIFIDSKSKVCEIFSYSERELSKMKYYIRVSNIIFELPISSIELHIYNHGVGILFIQLQNKKYNTIEEIKLINDLGRRISLPYIPDTKDGNIICAEEVGIIWGEERYITNYRELIKEADLCRKKQEIVEKLRELEKQLDRVESDRVYKEIKQEIKKINEEIKESNNNLKNIENKFMQPAEFLKRILWGDPKNTECGKNIVECKGFDDERMFTYCIIRNSELSKFIEDTKEDLLLNKEKLEKLYTIIYVDKDDATCQNRDMQKKLMERALYMRWSNWGTLYGITNYSFICITTDEEGVNASVVKPVILEYAYMISLVLAQRLGITLFSEEAGSVVTGVEQKGTIKSRKIKNLINLQEKYITFKNQLLLLEVTKQEQGIELYHLMQKQILVDEVQIVLDEQLERLYEVVNVSNGNKISVKGIWLARGAFWVSLISLIVTIYLGCCS